MACRKTPKSTRKPQGTRKPRASISISGVKASGTALRGFGRQHHHLAMKGLHFNVHGHTHPQRPKSPQKPCVKVPQKGLHFTPPTKH